MINQAKAARWIDAGPRYDLLKVLGEGGFGAVYRARLIGTEQEVALKALTRVKPEALARFKREFRALCEISHPNLVGLRELFEHQGQWFIAMDLVEGTDLLTWLRKSTNDNGFDERRLRQAFADVAQGLSALHAHGLLHRDLKPGNVRVTPDGKAVVLDFGLVTMADEDLQSTHRAGVGTVAYMPPEQSTGEKLTTAADLYALGASLYEALTGQLPFEAESLFALMLRKTNEEPRPPRDLVAHVPSELDALCVALLDRNPKQRPSIENVLRTLLGATATRSLAPPRTSLPVEETRLPFEGREMELERLAQALARTHEGELSLVFIEGVSGIGKSALAGEFVRRQLEKQPETWVLSGRCYEHERVPYKAFDACMDALAKRLARLAPELCRAVLPRRAGLLLELFPLLGAVKALAETSTQGAPAEPTARRLDAFTVLAELLGKLAESRPLILVIDDLQWSDEESLRLLRHLVHERPPPVMLLITVRPGRELNATVREALDERRNAPGVNWLSLRGLPQDAIEALARNVLGADEQQAALDRISYESAGHPMLVAELCYYARAHGGPTQRLTLLAALSARIATLTTSARWLLEALALCGRPHAEALFRRLGLTDTLDDVLKELFAQRFARRFAGQTIAIDHDRVREAVLSQLDPERRREIHHAIAQALEESGDGEPSELAEHWDQAGEPGRCSVLYLKAARLALHALAFDSAAGHYARAFALLGEEASVARGELLAQYGRALAGAGRSAEAAAAFTRAAEHMQGTERVRLNIWATQHQLQSAQLEDGVRNARAVLKELGIALPRGNTAALARIVYERTLLALRGTKVQVRKEFDAQEKLRLDAMTDLTFPLWWADFLPGNALTIMHVRRALALGEPGHAACALAQEGALRAVMSDHGAAPGLFALARELAEQSRLPSAVARVQLGEGVAAYMRGELELALSKCTSAEELLVASCPEEPWLLTNVRMTLGMVLTRSGLFPQLASASSRWLSEARARQDVFAETALFGLGQGHVAHLMADRPEEAGELLEQSLRPWRGHSTDMLLMGELGSRFNILAYTGGPGADAWFRQKRAQLDGAFLFKRGESRAILFFYRTLAVLAACAEVAGARRKELLAEAKRMAGKIEPNGFGEVLGPFARAQVQACSGDIDSARSAAQHAVDLTRARGEVSFGLSAEHLLGVLEGGEAGAARREASLAFLRERGWKDPWRSLAVYAPAMRILEGECAPCTRTDALFLARYRLNEALPTTTDDVLVDAVDARTGRTVTLRSLGRPEPALLGRLKEELRALESVHHENLARSEELIEHDGRWFVVLEQVPKPDLLSFVRPGGQLDVERLRAALSQTLAALGALHDAGATHGELRPEFVRVSEAGRSLVLGRGARVRPRLAEAEPEDLDYLAPEQIEGSGSSAAADVYALGTSLYEALTGQLPFGQLTAEKIVEAKLRGRPVPPWALRLSVPSDLEELCLAMLERDPAQRPSVREARTRLTGPQEASAAAQTARRAKTLASLTPFQVTSGSQHTFVGRARELETLRAALQHAQRGKLALICVQGEGGIGKTALVSEALEQLIERAPAAYVLRSRCYANEQLRFQAFDGAVDELARLLNQLPRAELEALLPARAALLAQLFPVLGSVPMIRGATKKGLPAEPAARRAAAIAAFVELVVRLSQRALLTLVIDDLQWADAESFTLLNALLAERDGVQLAIVAMLRPAEARDGAVSEALAQLLARPPLLTLALEKLGDDDARALARRLFGPETRDAVLELAARESSGHPLFLRELAQARVAGGSGAKLDLEHVLLQRIAALTPEARTLLELLALLSRPCPAHVLERAAGLGQGFDDALRALLRTELVQRRGPLGLACFHDRLREVVAEQVAPPRARVFYGGLAEALAAEPDSPAAERARLWDAAGEGERACEAYGLAGDHALAALSFATAERLYARALELAESTAEAPRARLFAQRAHAFVALARSAEAAALFEQAAQQASGAEAVRLRVWAAQHQIQSAQFDDGMRNARAVLEELDLPFPDGNARALSRIVWERSLLAVRGTHVDVKKTIDARDQLKLDALCNLSFPVSWADLLPGSALIIIHLRRALALGEPGHAARALAQESTMRAMLNEHSVSASLFALATRLAEESQLPAPLASVVFGEGVAALLRGELELALTKCMAAEELLLTSCPEEAWLLTNVRMNICMLLCRGGDFSQLASSFTRWFAEAQARRDVFASNALFGLGLGHTVFLMEDRLAEAFELFEETMRPWRTRPAGFAQVGELFARASLCCYQGGASSYAWLRETRAEHERSFFLRRGDGRLALIHARIMAALAARPESSTQRRAELLDEAKATLRGSRAKSIGAFLQPLASAQILALEGDAETALRLARHAATACAAKGEQLYRQSAEYLVGTLEGGEAGRVRRDASLAFFRERGWVDPWRGATLNVPAVRELEGQGH